LVELLNIFFSAALIVVKTNTERGTTIEILFITFLKQKLCGFDKLHFFSSYFLTSKIYGTFVRYLWISCSLH